MKKEYLKNLNKQLNQPIESSFSQLEAEVNEWLKSNKKRFLHKNGDTWNDLKWSLYQLEKEMLSISGGLNTNHNDKVDSIIKHIKHIQKNIIDSFDRSMRQTNTKLGDFQTELDLLELRLQILKMELKPKKSESSVYWNKQKKHLKEFLNKIRIDVRNSSKQVINISKDIKMALNNKLDIENIF